MSDTSVQISFGGQTSEFEAACQRALAAMKGLTDGVATLTAGLAASTQGLNATTPAMTATAKATDVAVAAVKQVSPAAQTATAAMQALVNATTGVDRATKSAASSADAFGVLMGEAATEVKALSGAASEAGGTIERTSGHMERFHGVTNRARAEVIVIAHEMLQGRFSRIPGSLMVLAEGMGGVSMAVMGTAAAVAGLAFGFYEVVAAAHAAEAAMAGANNVAVLQGRVGKEAEAAAIRWTTAMRGASLLSKSEARGIAVAISDIPGMSHQAKEALIELAPALAKVLDPKDPEKAAEAIGKIFQSTGSLRSFVEENRLLDGVQRQQFEAAVKAGEGYKAQALALDGLRARLGPAASQMATALKLQQETALKTKGDPHAILPTDPAELAQQTISLRMPQGGLAASEEDRHSQTVAEEYLHTLRERQKLEADELTIRQRLAAATTDDAKNEAALALRTNQEQQATLKNRGDTSWLQKQEGALKDQEIGIIRSAKTAKEAADAKLAAEEAYWRKLLTDETLTAGQREAVSARLKSAELRHAEEVLQARDRAATAAALAGKKSVQEQVAELSAEQAAHRENFVEWTRLEQQKLGILRAAYGEKSREFQTELRAEETYLRQHQAHLEALELQRIEHQNADGQKALAARISALGEEVAEHRLTKAEELAIARQATEDEMALELWKLDTFIKTLRMETEEYDKAHQQRLSLEAAFQSKLATLKTQQVTEERRAADRSVAVYASAFDRIGQQGEHVAQGLISGTMTWRQAEQQAASAVLQGVISTAGHIVARWAAAEAAETALKGQGTVARNAMDAGASPASIIAGILGRWLGLETAKTSATAGQTAARTATETVADATGAAARAASAVAEVGANAAVAASGAYAAIAAIPYVGPMMAPGAAATAYAGAAAWGASIAIPSFAVGAWSLPGDMIAQVHKGEMIVPAFAAEQVRNGGSVGGAGGGGDLHVHLNAIDTQSGAAFIAAQMPYLARRLKAHLSNNPSDRS